MENKKKILNLVEARKFALQHLWTDHWLIFLHNNILRKDVPCTFHGDLIKACMDSISEEITKDAAVQALIMKITEMDWVLALKICQYSLHGLDEFVYEVGWPAIQIRIDAGKRINLEKILQNCLKSNKVSLNALNIIVSDSIVQNLIIIIEKYFTKLFSKILQQKIKEYKKNHNNNTI